MWGDKFMRDLFKVDWDSNQSIWRMRYFRFQIIWIIAVAKKNLVRCDWMCKGPGCYHWDGNRCYEVIFTITMIITIAEHDFWNFDWKRESMHQSAINDHFGHIWQFMATWQWGHMLLIWPSWVSLKIIKWSSADKLDGGWIIILTGKVQASGQPPLSNSKIRQNHFFWFSKYYIVSNHQKLNISNDHCHKKLL